MIKVCSFCNTVNQNCKRCSRCSKVLYCNKLCQKKDWEHHKNFCKPSKHYNISENDFIDKIIEHCINTQVSLNINNECGVVSIFLYDILSKYFDDVHLFLGQVSMMGGEYVNHMWVECDNKIIDCALFNYVSEQPLNFCDIVNLQKFKNYINPLECKHDFIDKYKTNELFNNILYTKLLSNIF